MIRIFNFEFFFGSKGMGDSRDFAAELFDTLARRRGVNAENGIDLDQLKVFWEDIALQDSDTRLHIFFDM